MLCGDEVVVVVEGLGWCVCDEDEVSGRNCGVVEGLNCGIWELLIGVGSGLGMM